MDKSLTQDFPYTVDDLEKCLEWSYVHPRDAYGACWIAADCLVSASNDDLMWIGADHSNSPVKR